MTIVSIRLSDELFETMNSKAHDLHLSQSEYIREAIMRMNAQSDLAKRGAQLRKASQLVRKESMIINKEFSEIEQDPEVE